jgi:hypothetical protein
MRRARRQRLRKHKQAGEAVTHQSKWVIVGSPESDHPPRGGTICGKLSNDLTVC